jgi:hypothetical protein
MPEPELRATFLLTNAELADLVMRRLLRDPALCRQRRLAALGVAAMAVVIALLMLALLPTQSPELRLALPVGAALATGTLFVLYWPRATRRALTRLHQRQHGAGPHRCEVSLADSGVRRALGEASTELPWSRLLPMQRSGAELEFGLVDGNIFAVVPGRAFASEADRERFAAAAARLHSAASRATG